MADDRKNSKADDADLTPLQRYLAKQRTDTDAPVAPDDPREEIMSVPKEPPASPPPPPVAGSESVSAVLDGSPAGFFSRFFAYMIDTLVVFGISLPIRGFMAFILWFLPFGAGDASIGSMSLGSFLAVQIVTFFYYGWFYTEKGATPGKMLFGLQVCLVPSGTKPSYAIAYFRESLGKYISGLILLIGYFVALFRDDHRALHDLAFGTRVIVKRR